MGEDQIRELIREERNRYAREWRRKNPERVAEINRKYWARKALERMASMDEGGERERG